MPLPFVLAGAAVVAGIYGVKKGVDAHADNSRAHDLNEEAASAFDRAKRDLERSREVTRDALDALGQLKLEVWNSQLGRFVDLFRRLKNVRLDGSTGVGDLKPLSAEELEQMNAISMRAGEVLSGGVTALGAGALAGMAAYGGAFMLGTTATTGTAIASLTGVAATNATLAWLGGGALAAGGFGMAGGMAVLGGIVAGPVLAVGGMFLAAKAEENLANARRNLAEARRAAEQMASAAAVLDAIAQLSSDYRVAILELDRRMTGVLDGLEALIAKAGTDYASYSTDQRKAVHVASKFAEVMKGLLETRLLDTEGGIDPAARRFLEGSRQERAALKSAG